MTTTPLRALLLALLLSFAGAAFAPPARGQEEGSAPFSGVGTTAEAIDHFLDGLRAALARNDHAAIAAMAEYPLNAWNGKKSVKLESKSDLVRQFDTIFDASLRKTIQDASAKTAWANWQGVMFDGGRIWLRPGPPNDTLRIVTINPPVAHAPR